MNSNDQSFLCQDHYTQVASIWDPRICIPKCLLIISLKMKFETDWSNSYQLEYHTSLNFWVVSCWLRWISTYYSHNMNFQSWAVAHWEELLQTVSNFIFRLIISKHYGYRVRGLKRSKKLWGIKNYPLGQSHNNRLPFYRCKIPLDDSN